MSEEDSIQAAADHGTRPRGRAAPVLRARRFPERAGRRRRDGEELRPRRADQAIGGRDAQCLSQFPPDWRDRVMHVRMTVGNDTLMGGDAPPDHYQAPHGFCVSVSAATRADAERMFNELSANGKITMPFQETFWSSGFGM